jgi:molybdate transport system substrate-binding protein
MRRRLLALSLVGCLWLLAGCGGQAGLVAREDEPGELLVFTAASLTEAFTEIGKVFEAQHPGSRVLFNIAGSQQLAQQLAQGAPADVFASANARQMDVAVEAGRVMSGTAQPFVRNRLVVVFPQANQAGIKTLNDLAKPGVKLVLAAKEVPVGQYALDFLVKAGQDAAFGAGFKEGVVQNVVSYEENVRAVLSKVILGEADAGIVYTSDISQGSAAQVGRLEIPDRLNTIATYPIAPITDSEQPELAATFVRLVLAPEGQAILAKYGFLPVSP